MMRTMIETDTGLPPAVGYIDAISPSELAMHNEQIAERTLGLVSGVFSHRKEHMY